MRALSIAVTGTVLGASFVGAESAHTTISIHGDVVQSTVETAGKLRNVDIKGELLVEELEHEVLGIRLHEVNTGADILSELVFGDEAERERVAGGGDTVGGGIVDTFDLAVLCAGGVVRAELLVPFVAGVAVSVATLAVRPAPVRVEDHRGLHGRAGLRAGGTSAFLDRQLRVGFGLRRSGELSAGCANEGQGKQEEVQHLEKSSP